MPIYEVERNGRVFEVDAPTPQAAAQALAGMSAPTPPQGSAVRRFVSNAAEMLNPIEAVKGVYQAVRHPVDTATAIVQAQGEQFGQARDLLREGRYSEAVGHAAAGALPLVGPAAAAAGEQIASGDIAGGIGKAAGLIAPFSARPVMQGVRAVLPTSTRAAVAGSLEAGAAERIAGQMAPKVGANKSRFGNQASKVAPAIAQDLATEGAPLSRQGFHGQIKAKLVEAESALDAASDARLNAATFDTKPILDGLLEKRAQLTAPAVQASRPIPSVTGQAVREVPVDFTKQYALKWMKDEMETFPFTKHTWTDVSQEPGLNRGNAGGGAFNIVPGSAGAPVYRGIIGPEGSPLVHATRSDVLKAIDAELAGRPGSGTLRELVRDFADGLVKGEGQSFMLTPGPMGEANPVTSRLVDLQKGAATSMPVRVGRPLGRNVIPTPNAARVKQLDRAIAEVKALGPVARYESVRKLRQAYDQPAKAVYSPSMTADYLKKRGESLGSADVTGVLRDTLAKWDPDTATANAQYALYRTADDVLNAAAEVERARPKVGRQIMARLTGVIFGGQQGGVAGAAVGYLAAPIVDSALASGATTQFKTAALMTKLATAIRRGDVGQVTSLTHTLKRLVPTAARQTGLVTSGSLATGVAGPIGQPSPTVQR